MIETYSPSWLTKYSEESRLMKSKLGDLIFDIQHIGSTAIPGIKAKPIIDIMVAVKSLKDSQALFPILEKLGYSYKPELSSTERFFFRKGDPVEFHLSIAEPGHTLYWENQILFRNFLIEHPEYAKEYEMIKVNAVENLPGKDLLDLSRSQTYSDKKGPCIRKILELAKKEIST